MVSGHNIIFLFCVYFLYVYSSLIQNIPTTASLLYTRLHPCLSFSPDPLLLSFSSESNWPPGMSTRHGITVNKKLYHFTHSLSSLVLYKYLPFNSFHECSLKSITSFYYMYACTHTIFWVNFFYINLGISLLSEVFCFARFLQKSRSSEQQNLAVLTMCSFVRVNNMWRRLQKLPS